MYQLVQPGKLDAGMKLNELMCKMRARYRYDECPALPHTIMLLAFVQACGYKFVLEIMISIQQCTSAWRSNMFINISKSHMFIKIYTQIKAPLASKRDVAELQHSTLWIKCAPSWPGCLSLMQQRAGRKAPMPLNWCTQGTCSCRTSWSSIPY